MVHGCVGGGWVCRWFMVERVVVWLVDGWVMMNE